MTIATKPPQPGWAPVSDFNSDEVKAFKLAGKIDPTGQWLMNAAPGPTKAQTKAAETQAKHIAAIPKPPPGVAERIAASKALQSSFVRTDDKGNVIAASDDGGAQASATVVPKIDNPDWAGKPKEALIDFADKERFLASLLGGIPFTKTFELFGGKVSVTFQTLTCRQQEETSKQCWLDSNHEVTMVTDKQAMAESRVVQFAQYLFTASLKEISSPGDLPRAYHPFDEAGNPAAGILPIKVAHRKLRDDFPWPLYNALMQVHERFCELCNTMTREAQNPSFWSPDAGT